MMERGVPLMEGGAPLIGRGVPMMEGGALVMNIECSHSGRGASHFERGASSSGLGIPRP